MVDPRLNPYTPGAGAMPPELAGRDELMSAFDVALDRVAEGRHDRSILLTGLRGVGKTVLLNAFQDMAVTKGWETSHLEATRDTPMSVELLRATRSVLLDVRPSRKVKEKLKRALMVLHSFALTLPDGGQLSFDVGPLVGRADSGSLQRDLLEVLTSVGELMRDLGSGLLFLIDEAHLVDRDSFEALIVALHRVASQLALPVMVTAAGLPLLPTLTEQAKTYAERLFLPTHLGPLTREEATEALAKPARDLGVEYERAALDLVLDASEGYPYFLQEFGKFAWNTATSARISKADAERALQHAIRQLDGAFFINRLRAATPAGQGYLRAMASLGKGPYRTGAVAEAMKKSATTVSKLREGLVAANLVWQPAYGTVDFTVPQFGQFLARHYGQ